MTDWKIHVHTKEDVERLRERLREFVLGDLPAEVNEEDCVGMRSTGTLRFHGPYGMEFAARHYTRTLNQKVVVYCEGHYGHYENSLEAIGGFLSNGCDVIAMAMPLNEPNSLGVWGADLETHYDLERTPKPIWPFMHPWQVLVEWAAAMYGWENLSICGISGGGWSCALYAALDPRVQSSYPVAGVLPEALRGPAEQGDFEERWSPLYAIASYMDLFILGAAGRRQTQIFNMYDPNYGGDRAWKYVNVMRAALSEVGGWFDVWIDETHRDHKCSRWAAARICGDMG
ncbi:MAG TPA: hypothetical protein VMW24_13450 [Sedimentisphaerales bacterium]|nr:hypothetical protein [Sedimentisphaerales bacterium]